MVDLSAALPASALGLATTAHAVIGVVRAHRNRPSSAWLAVPSVALAVAPWLYPAVAAVVAGLAVHLAWLIVCDRVAGRGRKDRSPDSLPRSTGPMDFVPLPIVSLTDVSPTIRSIRVARPAGLAFTAGQFLTVRVHIDGKAFVRCYSISSAPEDSYLEISVKRQGVVSNSLHASLRSGSHLFVRPPAGRFVYPGDTDAPMVLVAGGVGITPLISMARHAIAVEPSRQVTLLYSARHEQELAFWDRLCAMSRTHAQFRAIATLTSPGPDWTGRVGRLNEPAIRECVPDPAHAVYLMCGPSEMIDGMRLTLLAMGVADDRIRFEVFQPAAAIGARGRAAAGDATALDTAEWQVTFSRSQRTTSASAAQSLLDAAEDADVPIPSLCRAGVCGTCRTRVTAGDVECLSDAVGADRADGWVLPCVASAKSDCTLDA